MNEAPWPVGERIAAEDGLDLGPLLARAGILLFEYDADGTLVDAIGSCFGSSTPDNEVRLGLVSPATVRRTTAGQMVVEWVRVADRTIAVHHEPVRGDCDHVERVVATAFDVTNVSLVTPLHMPGAAARPRPPLHARLGSAVSS